MNPYVIIAAILMFCASHGAAYYKGRADESAVAVEHERDALIEYAKKISTAGEQHAKDEQIIADSAAAARRLRIKFAMCAKSSDSNGASGTLQPTVDDAFARLQEGTGRLIERCDRLNIDAIESNAVR